jgi:uncharacterized protein (DUF1697 family)
MAKAESAAIARDTHIALLRGINVGGKNKLPMATLTSVVAQLGCEDVRTYIQSGNVVYRAGRALSQRVGGLISRAIADKLGLAIPVVTRSAAELFEVIEESPFRGGEDALHIAFLSSAPDAKAAASLDPQRSPPDSFVVSGREVYLHCPNGLGKTRLTNAYLDSKLGVTCTVRNWRTVLALAQLARGEAVAT